MPTFDSPAVHHPIKIILLGKPIDGKTGAKASLISAGWKLRTLDTDHGVEVLWNLLQDSHFPYNNYIKKHNIDLSQSSYIPITQNMSLQTIDRHIKDAAGNTLRLEKIRKLGPVDSKAWADMYDTLDSWIDGPNKFGKVTSWGSDVILDIDTFSTAARYAYYFVQGFNNRLGALDEGYDYQRDVGQAQGLLRTLLETLFSPAIKCNVIINCHINWVDVMAGFAQSPGERQRKNQPSNPDGLPDCIGQALSPKMAKYFNNIFVMKRTGSSGSTRRSIYTVPVDGVIARRSTWMEDNYDISTGLAEIFSILSNKPLPDDFLESLNPYHKPKSQPKPQAQSFGNRPLNTTPATSNPFLNIKPAGG